MTNKWVTYVNRSYSSIKTAITQRLETEVPELSDKSPSNLLQIIVDIFAGVGELINYYIDTMAREWFLGTARLFSSIIKLAELANYNGKAKVASEVSLVFTANDTNGDPIEAGSSIVIPAGELITDDLGNTWTTPREQILREGYFSALVSAIQYSAIAGELLGTSDGSIDQSFALPHNYREASLEIDVEGDLTWSREETLGFSKANDKHFMVKMFSDAKIYLVFGDGVNGKIPVGTSVISINYHNTGGSTGNVSIGAITTYNDSGLSLPGNVSSVTVTNPVPAYGGREIEGIEELRRAIPISLRTLNRAVTRSDYEDIAVLAPGIRAARVAFECGTRVGIYVVTYGGGVPSQSTLASTKEFIEDKSMLSLRVEIYPSGETHIRGTLEIVGRYRITSETITTATKVALYELYNPYISRINQDVRLSDIIAAIDNLPEVDYLTMPAVYAQPYLRPSSLTTFIGYNIEVLDTSIVKTTWAVVWDAAGSVFDIYKDGLFVLSTASGVQNNDVEGLLNIYFDADPAGAVQDDHWDFVVYPYGVDIPLDDLSIPIIGPGDFVINVTEIYST